MKRLMATILVVVMGLSGTVMAGPYTRYAFGSYGGYGRGGGYYSSYGYGYSDRTAQIIDASGSAVAGTMAVMNEAERWKVVQEQQRQSHENANAEIQRLYYENQQLRSEIEKLEKEIEKLKLEIMKLQLQGQLQQQQKTQR